MVLRAMGENMALQNRKEKLQSLQFKTQYEGISGALDSLPKETNRRRRSSLRTLWRAFKERPCGSDDEQNVIFTNSDKSHRGFDPLDNVWSSVQRDDLGRTTVVFGIIGSTRSMVGASFQAKLKTRVKNIELTCEVTK
jgi:hypothetical protein